MTKQYQMRELEPEDAARCAELELSLFAGDSPWSQEAFITEFSIPSNRYLGIFDDDLLVAYAGLATMGPAADPEFEVHTIGVDITYQRQGHGRVLMTELMNSADQQDGPVFLEVRTDNLPAIAMYESFGFSIIGFRKNYYRPSGADALTMMRNRRSERPASL